MQDIFSKYKKKKSSVISIALVLGAVVMILTVIVPQISSIGEVSQQITSKKEHVTMLKKSYAVLSSQPDEAVNTSFAAVDKALPNTKNVLAVFNALSGVAAKTNVQMEGFTLQVGNLYQKDKKKQQEEITNVKGVPVLSVTLRVVSATQGQVVEFADLLYKSLPLAEIKTLNVTKDAGDFQINFFYKPYDLQNLAEQEQIDPLDSQAQQALRTINEWQGSGK